MYDIYYILYYLKIVLHLFMYGGVCECCVWFMHTHITTIQIWRVRSWFSSSTELFWEWNSGYLDLVANYAVILTAILLELTLRTLLLEVAVLPVQMLF